MFRIEGLKELSQNLRKVLGLIYRSDRRLSLVHVLMLLCTSVLPLALLYAVKYLVDAVEQLVRSPQGGVPGEIWLFVAVFGLIYLFNRLCSIFDGYISGLLGEKTVNNIQRMIQMQSAEVDMSYFDTPSYYDAMYMAQQESSHRPLMLLDQMTSLVSELITLIGVVCILCAFSFWTVPVMILAGVPAIWVHMHRVKVLYAWRKSRIKDNREANYHAALQTNRSFAKEVRIYGLSGFVQSRFWEIRNRLYRQRREISGKTSFLSALTVCWDMVTLLLILCLLLHKTWAGLLTVGGFVMYFQAFRKGGGAMRSIVKALSGVYENHLFLSNLFQFLELEHHIQSPAHPVPFPSEIREGIRFDKVTFRYPGAETNVLDKADYFFEPNRINRISGANGMGKTTLVKLLCRLYDPEEGSITVDGTDIRKFDLGEFRRNIAVIFQDFVGYAFTAEDNVTFGRRREESDPDDFQRALVFSGADEVIKKLPHREKTLLGKLFEGGEELSMGQWQRIALARALYRRSPILILDEPNSWMDAEGRANFRKHLPELCRDRLVILISHEDADGQK
ncbi:MAG: ABC transporter ATP-binding protein [Bacteroidales bacterium]|nr:ABC transporter ATP-binding protein [Bacteroidales bacterium]MBP5614590.1 ABC transporter ATP-binding protein [Bacteroidales bacterium]